MDNWELFLFKQRNLPSADGVRLHDATTTQGPSMDFWGLALSRVTVFTEQQG